MGGGSMLRRMITATILVLAIAPAAAAQPTLRIEPFRFMTDDGTEVDAELGRVAVRENRTGSGTRQIELVFVRLKSTSQTPGPPIVYLAGGPGGSGIATAKGPRFPVFNALRAVADVI